MVSVEERMKVLNLLQQGSITPEQAAQLLQAMDSGAKTPAAAAPAAAPVDAPMPEPPAAVPYTAPAPEAVIAAAPAPNFPDLPAAPAASGVRARWLRVRVSDMATGRPRVNIRLPLSLVNFGLKMGQNFAPEMQNIDVNELAHALQSGEPGPFVDVYDEDDGEHVEVFLE